jgi:hypothetical protein
MFPLMKRARETVTAAARCVVFVSLPYGKDSRTPCTPSTPGKAEPPESARSRYVNKINLESGSKMDQDCIGGLRSPRVRAAFAAVTCPCSVKDERAQPACEHAVVTSAIKPKSVSCGAQLLLGRMGDPRHERGMDTS